MTTSTNLSGSNRWTPIEYLFGSDAEGGEPSTAQTGDDNVSSGVKRRTKQGDVWSFGMTVLVGFTVHDL